MLSSMRYFLHMHKLYFCTLTSGTDT